MPTSPEAPPPPTPAPPIIIESWPVDAAPAAHDHKGDALRPQELFVTDDKYNLYVLAAVAYFDMDGPGTGFSYDRGNREYGWAIDGQTIAWLGTLGLRTDALQVKRIEADAILLNGEPVLQGSGPQGERGERGPRGLTGAQGPSGASIVGPAGPPGGGGGGSAEDWSGVVNVTEDRTVDMSATTIDEVANVLGTLISDMRAAGMNMDIEDRILKAASRIAEVVDGDLDSYGTELVRALYEEPAFADACAAVSHETLLKVLRGGLLLSDLRANRDRFCRL